MIERPILFTAPMVRAIIEGRKTMTRRVVKPQPFCPKSRLVETNQGHAWTVADGYMNHQDWQDGMPRLWECPYGQPGDQLWVRETWAPYDDDALREQDKSGIGYRADAKWKGSSPYSSTDINKDGKWKPSIYIPRWASRITLEVTAVRVEKIHSISAKDILAEGAVERPHEDPYLGKCPISAFDGKMYPDLRSLWANGWDKLNAKRGFGWNQNPWTWVISFRRIKP